MSRFIDADRIEWRLIIPTNVTIAEENMIHLAKKLVERQPTADVVKVVRCEKCTYGYIYPNNFNGYCRKRRNMVYANDFCSEGERIDE